MERPKWVHNRFDVEAGIARQLAPGLDTQIFVGDQLMLSLVTIAPNAEGKMHDHPEEQWGVLLAGSCTRIQGNEQVVMGEGDFWHTPGDIPHTIIAGPEGATILDIFSPPRPEYRTAGSGFGDSSGE